MTDEEFENDPDWIAIQSLAGLVGSSKTSSGIDKRIAAGWYAGAVKRKVKKGGKTARWRRIVHLSSIQEDTRLDWLKKYRPNQSTALIVNQKRAPQPEHSLDSDGMDYDKVTSSLALTLQKMDLADNPLTVRLLLLGAIAKMEGGGIKQIEAIHRTFEIMYGAGDKHIDIETGESVR